MGDLKSELEALRVEVERLKPKPIDHEAAAKWQSEMHEAAERRMSRAGNFSREDLAAMEAACPTDAVKDIVARGGIRGPSGHGAGGTVSSVHGPSGVYPNTSGWREATPIGPPHGIELVDRLMDAQDRRDRHELILEEAKRRAAEQVILQAANRRADEPK
jgi:hypothetical protein